MQTICGADLVELCVLWVRFGGILCCVGQSCWNCVMCGQSWWNCVMFGAELMELCDVWGELVELCRRCVGSVGGIVQTMCAICFELRTIKYLSGTAVLFCTYTSCLLYEVKSQDRDFRWLWGEK